MAVPAEICYELSGATLKLKSRKIKALKDNNYKLFTHLQFIFAINLHGSVSAIIS